MANAGTINAVLLAEGTEYGVHGIQPRHWTPIGAGGLEVMWYFSNDEFLYNRGTVLVRVRVPGTNSAEQEGEGTEL